MGLHADGVDDGVGAEAAGEVADRLADVVDLVEVHRLDAATLCAPDAFWHTVDADDPSSLVGGDARGHVADRAESENGDRSAAGDLGVLDRLPGRR